MVQLAGTASEFLCGGETAGVFVVDDLVNWLVERLADAGYQKLKTLVGGSDQARALKKAVRAAVQATVGEIGPIGGAEADRAADQINRAFRRRDPVPLPPGQPTLLEALQAGIARQLSILDDTGQPVVAFRRCRSARWRPTCPVTWYARSSSRGSRGGALAPLADQLNADLSQLREQRIESKVGQVLDRLGDALAPPEAAAAEMSARGQPAAAWDLRRLGVHAAISAPGIDDTVPPEYVPRDVDDGESGFGAGWRPRRSGAGLCCWSAVRRWARRAARRRR